MGQKIHPTGFRIGVIRDWESNWYADKDYAALLKEDHEIRTFLRKRLAQAAVSRITIDRQVNKVRVQIHTGKPGVIIGRGGRGVDDLKAALEQKIKKQVNLAVQEIRQPDLDAQLVSESIAQQIEKRIAPKRAMRQAIQRSMRAGARGIRLQVSGRLGGSEMARRENDKQGKIPLHTLRADVDYGFSEAATTYGHIGIKTWLYRGDILPHQYRTMKETGQTPESFMPRREERRRDRTGEEQDRRSDRGPSRGGRGGGGGGGGRGGRGGGGGGGRGRGG